MKDHLIRPTTEFQRGEIFNTSRERFVDFPLLRAKRGIPLISHSIKRNATCEELRSPYTCIYFPERDPLLHFSLAKNDKDSREYLSLSDIYDP